MTNKFIIYDPININTNYQSNDRFIGKVELGKYFKNPRESGFNFDSSTKARINYNGLVKGNYIRVDINDFITFWFITSKVNRSNTTILNLQLDEISTFIDTSITDISTRPVYVNRKHLDRFHVNKQIGSLFVNPNFKDFLNEEPSLSYEKVDYYTFNTYLTRDIAYKDYVPQYQATFKIVPPKFDNQTGVLDKPVEIGDNYYFVYAIMEPKENEIIGDYTGSLEKPHTGLKVALLGAYRSDKGDKYNQSLSAILNNIETFRILSVFISKTFIHPTHYDTGDLSKSYSLVGIKLTEENTVYIPFFYFMASMNKSYDFDISVQIPQHVKRGEKEELKSLMKRDEFKEVKLLTSQFTEHSYYLPDGVSYKTNPGFFYFTKAYTFSSSINPMGIGGHISYELSLTSPTPPYLKEMLGENYYHTYLPHQLPVATTAYKSYLANAGNAINAERENIKISTATSTIFGALTTALGAGLLASGVGSPLGAMMIGAGGATTFIQGLTNMAKSNNKLDARLNDLKNKGGELLSQGDIYSVFYYNNEILKNDKLPVAVQEVVKRINDKDRETVVNFLYYNGYNYSKYENIKTLKTRKFFDFGQITGIGDVLNRVKTGLNNWGVDEEIIKNIDLQFNRGVRLWHDSTLNPIVGIGEVDYENGETYVESWINE